MSYHVKDKLKTLSTKCYFGCAIQADFDAKLAEAGDNLVVVDFFAVWCGPCKMIAPKLEEMAAEYPDIVVLKVDVDECEDLVAIYEISSMPTFVFIKNKAKVNWIASP
uniref:Thioredoxin domain-containing protein n=1 Tax=Timema monikensis TaxID=170555 RepID=A0A7R9E831_9NEOP|nr:unnamed protein product [Timema monikensis]